MHITDGVWKWSQKLPGNYVLFVFLLRNLLFEHHSNQVWYLLEPSEKNIALNFESQLKN